MKQKRRKTTLAAFLALILSIALTEGVVYAA